METDDFKIAFEKLTELLKRQQAEHLAKPGWSKLENDDGVWENFSKIFKFRPSTQAKDWPGIVEPKPSRTFSISHIYGPNFDKLTKELSLFYSACFANIIPVGQTINVLDWQHPCFAFDPHAGFKFQSMEEWPIPPLPNGDYYIFMTEDLSGGFFGHPWEQTICVMGETFVSHLENAPHDVFSKLIRSDGVEV
ncbi:MAG: DUF2716 domain-containing protein [Litorimonas sp.]